MIKDFLRLDAVKNPLFVMLIHRLIILVSIAHLFFFFYE